MFSDWLHLAFNTGERMTLQNLAVRLLMCWVPMAAVLCVTATAQSRPAATKCAVVFSGDWIREAATDFDEVSACANGELVAVHAFVAPAFDSSQTQKRTTWEYPGKLKKNDLLDLQRILLRPDISALPDRLQLDFRNTPRGAPRFTMEFHVLRDGIEQSVTLEGLPYLACQDKPEEILEGAWALFCLYGNLYNRAKSGAAASDGGCGCPTLHGMATVDAVH
jgi:hypothetical protein